MPFNITIDHATTAHSSDRSASLTDEEEGSSGVQVSPSAVGSHEYSDSLSADGDRWDIVNAEDDLGPSDSASRPRTSNHHRPVVEAPQPEAAYRQPPLREHSHPRIPQGVPHGVPRVRRQPPLSPGSVDSNEEWAGYARGPPAGRTYAQYVPVSGGQYLPQGYHSPHPGSSIVPAGSQMIVASPPAPYGYPPQQPGVNPNMQGYFGQGHHGAHPVPLQSASPYGGQEMMAHGGGYFPYPPQGYSMPYPYPHHGVFPPPPAAHSPSPASELGRDDEKFARLEKMMLDQRAADLADKAAIAAAVKKAEDEKNAKAAEDKRVADEVAIKLAAAAKEKEEADKKAAEEKAKADAAAKAAAPPPPPPAPEPKKAPIKFKDAVGRKFSFPFHLCNTWGGMEELIRQAFLHVELIGPHVADGHYDLVGPNGEIILPQVWETMIEPDWTITMHMWPMPEKKEREGGPLPPPGPGSGHAAAHGRKGGPPPPPPPPFGGFGGPRPAGVEVLPSKKSRPRPTSIFGWGSSSRPKPKPAVKGAKKAGAPPPAAPAPPPPPPPPPPH